VQHIPDKATLMKRKGVLARHDPSPTQWVFMSLLHENVAHLPRLFFGDFDMWFEWMKGSARTFFYAEG
jgi:hypothetical protein